MVTRLKGRDFELEDGMGKEECITVDDMKPRNMAAGDCACDDVPGLFRWCAPCARHVPSPSEHEPCKDACAPTSSHTSPCVSHLQVGEFPGSQLRSQQIKAKILE